MKIDTALLWGIIGGALLILFLPLFVANTLFFPFITGKAFAFRAIVEIIAALWIILAFRDPSVRPRRSILLYAAGAFLLSLLVSVFLSANPDKSFWSNFERMEGWIGIAHIVLYFTVLLSVFNTEKLWKWFWNTAIIASVLQGLYGVGQLFGWFTINQGGVRLDGQFGNATYLAIYMLFSFFITLLALHWWGRKEGNGRWLSLWYSLAALLQAVIIFYTATRGTILGLIGGLFIAGLVVAFTGERRDAFRKWGIGVLVALVVIAGGFYAIQGTPLVQNNEVLSRIASIDTPQKLLEQGSTRFAIWHMAWQGFLERPVFGWGQESFNYVFNAHYKASLYNQEPWFDRAHNEFLDWLVAGGIVGFLLWVSFFALVLYYLWRRGNTFSAVERGLFTGLLAGYACHDLFVFDNLMSYVYFFSILAYIAYRAQSTEGKTEELGKPLPQETFTIAAPLVVVAMVLVLYFVNWPGIAAASDIIQGLSPHQEGLTTNFDYFKKAVSDVGVSGLGAQEVHEQIIQFATQVKSLNAGDAAFQSEVAKYAADQMGEEVKSAPNDARLRLFYGSYLLTVGSLDAARPQLVAAQKLSPEKQAIFFELAALELSSGNTAAALSWAKQAFDLAPAYDSARTFYAGVAIRTGNRSLASSLLMPRYGTMTPDDDTIFSSYVAIKDYQDALAILSARIAANPANYQPHVDAASILLQTGDRADAIAELKKAMALNPSFATQGQQYIDAINSGQL